jgi:sporulation protein YlmC with PRC-barrel domain
MLFSYALRLRVVDTATANTVGRVDDIVVDPHTRTIAALRVDGRGADVLHWPDITGFGADAVTVASATAVGDPTGRTAGLLGRDYQVVGKRLLTDSGDEIGRVLDVEFDPDTGSVTGLLATIGRIDGGRLVGCGSYAAVVRMEQ